MDTNQNQDNVRHWPPKKGRKSEEKRMDDRDLDPVGTPRTFSSLWTSMNPSKEKPLFRPLVCRFYRTGRECRSGAQCPFWHEIPKNSNTHRGTGLDDPVMVEFMAKAGDMGPLEPPKNKSVKTLYIRRLNSSVLEQDIRDHFSPYGEIESIIFFTKTVPCAFLTYTTRQAAEKAMLELSTWTDIKSQRLKLLWGKTPGTLPQKDQPLPMQPQIITEGHGFSSSSYLMPPHPSPHLKESESKRRKIG